MLSTAPIQAMRAGARPPGLRIRPEAGRLIRVGGVDQDYAHDLVGVQVGVHPGVKAAYGVADEDERPGLSGPLHQRVQLARVLSRVARR